MKKNQLLFSLAVLILATALSGCHAEIFGEDGTPPSVIPTPTPSPTPPIIAPVAKFSISKSDFVDERIETFVENVSINEGWGYSPSSALTEDVATFNSMINRYIDAAVFKTCEDVFDGEVPGYTVINHLEDLGYIYIKGATDQDTFFVFEFSCEDDGEIEYFHFGNVWGDNVIKRPNEAFFIDRVKTEKYGFFNGFLFTLDTEQIIRRNHYYGVEDDVCFNKTTLAEEPCTTESLNASFKDYFESFDSLGERKHVLIPEPLYRRRSLTYKFLRHDPGSLGLAKNKIYLPGFGPWYNYDFYRIHYDGIYTMFDFKNSSTWNSLTDCYEKGSETFCFEGDRIKKYSYDGRSIEYYEGFDVETSGSGIRIISSESTMETIYSDRSEKITFQENSIKYERYDFVTPATFRSTSTTDTSYIHCFDYNANTITTEEDCN